MMINKIFDMHQEQLEVLAKTVKISHTEVERLVIEKLIQVRNNGVERNDDMSHFDKVIRHWLNADEFQEMVENNDD